ncbi:MAG: hypothetical protein AB8G05_24125 [Oligoflexales bacterium]
MRVITAFSIFMTSNILFASSCPRVRSASSVMDFLQEEELNTMLKPSDEMNSSQEIYEYEQQKYSFADIKGAFYQSNPPVYPNYLPPPPVMSFYTLSESLQLDLAPFRLNVDQYASGYRSWFVKYSHDVNICIFNSRNLLRDLHERFDIVLDTYEADKQMRSFAFEHCVSAYKGFIFIYGKPIIICSDTLRKDR